MKGKEVWKRTLAWMLAATMAAGGSLGAVSAEDTAAVQETEIAAAETEETSAETEALAAEPETGAEEELILEPDYADVELAEEDFPTVPVPVANDTEIVTIIDENSFPDAVFRRYVSENIDTNQDGKLSQAEADAVVEIIDGYYYYDEDEDKHYRTEDLTGIEYFQNLMKLDCSSGITNLDVSRNTALTELYCRRNQLTSLDVSKNSALTHLDCSENQLTSLNMGKNAALTELKCYSNKLTSLDVSQSTALEELNCSHNELTNLDVSQNTVLTDLECWGNQLTNLDVSRNTALTELYCDSNKLTSLDVSQNTALEWLNCSYNALASLDASMLASGCTAYYGVECQEREVQLKDTGENLVLDMAELVGRSNLKRITGLSKIADEGMEEDTEVVGDPLEMSEDGTIAFPKDQFPVKVIYEYDIKAKDDYGDDVMMDVTLCLVNKPEHVHNYQTVTKEPTCTESGITYEECTGCQQKKEGSEKTIPALGHTGGKATCEKGAVCTVCGKEYTAPAGHSYGAWTKTSEATVLKKAVQTRTCSVCGKQEMQETGALVPATIKLNASSLKMKTKQKTTKMTVTMGAGDSVVSVKSSNTKVLKASVKKNKITLTAQKKTGKANLTVTLASGKSKTIKVTVQSKSVATTKIKGVSKKLTLKKKQKATLKPTLDPITSQDKIKYTSSNKKVATVSSKGVITAKGKGKATITVKAGKKTVKCTVTVK